MEPCAERVQERGGSQLEDFIGEVSEFQLYFFTVRGMKMDFRLLVGAGHEHAGHGRSEYIGGCGPQSNSALSTRLFYEHPQSRSEVRAQGTERSRRLVGAPDLHAILAEIGL